MKQNRNLVSRRSFMKTSAAAFAAGGLLPGKDAEKPGSDPNPKDILNYHPDMVYRKLGNTGLFVSVISLGGIGLIRQVASYALDRGVNLIHMSTTYNHGKAVRELKEALKGKRQRVYIALKDTFDRIDDVLSILGTDTIDILMFNRHSEEKVSDPKIRDMFESLKNQGKVRLAGLTSHDQVKACVARAVRDGFFHVLQPVLNQPALEAMDLDLRGAMDKGMGVMAMKSMKGMEGREMQVAYLKKLLKHPAVTTVNKSFPDFESLDLYIRSVREVLTGAEDFSLYQYAQLNRSRNCMMCGECEKVCPQGLWISTILRSKTYYHDQLGDRETALSAMAEASFSRAQLEGCRGCARCERACPNGIRITEMLAGALELQDVTCA